MWVYTGKQTVNISTAIRIDIDRENAGKLTSFKVVAIFTPDLKIELASVEYLHHFLNYKDEWDDKSSLQFIVGMNTAVGECEKVIKAVNTALQNKENFCDVTAVYLRMVSLKESGQVISL